MPYRALMITMVTCGLALLAVTLYLSALSPFLGPQTAAATTRANDVRILTRGTMLLAFTLVCLLLVIGMAVSLREWLKLRYNARMRQKTPYVDAWKIAGERMKPPEKED